MTRLSFLLVLWFFAVPALAPVLAQAPTDSTAIRLYLDCDRCDEQFIKTEIDFVDFVRERTQADIHLLVTTQRTASGGNEYSLYFIGLRRFSGRSDELEYVSLGTDTRDESRVGLVQIIKLGLVPYLARTELGPRLSIMVDGPQRSRSTVPVDDKWNAWAFNIGTNGRFSGEESTKNYRVRANLSANRITDDWKIRSSLWGNYQESRYDLDSGFVKSISRDASFYGLAVASMNNHWSIGASTYANTSSRQNTDFSVSAGPAIEYSVFPYSESTRRELRIQYRFRAETVRYQEITIFDRTAETLLEHALEMNLDLNQPWGGAEAGIELSQLLTNFEESRLNFYRLELQGGMNVRLVRGLSINFGGGVSFIHDQLFLAQESISDEDVLLGTIQLPTSYEFEFNMGLNYSFGSIYNNVVNPRFGR